MTQFSALHTQFFIKRELIWQYDDVTKKNETGRQTVRRKKMKKILSQLKRRGTKFSQFEYFVYYYIFLISLYIPRKKRFLTPRKNLEKCKFSIIISENRTAIFWVSGIFIQNNFQVFEMYSNIHISDENHKVEIWNVGTNLSSPKTWKLNS